MQACKVSGNAKLPYFSKKINVVVEDNFSLLQQGVELIPSFEHIKPGSNRVYIGIYSSLCENVVLQKDTVVGQVKATNIMPPLLAPKDELTYYDVPEYESEYLSEDDMQNTY